MKILALDTSSNACSVAIQCGDAMHNTHVVEPRAHTRILLPMIRQLLQECGLVAADLDAVVLGNGPGSFIGMRIGASVAQGICFASGSPIVPVSSLAAIAAEAFANSAHAQVVVAQDARMGEVYVARFERSDGDLPVLCGKEEIVASDVYRLLDNGVALAGAGWHRYPDMTERNRDHVVECLDLSEPNALHLLRIAVAGDIRTLGMDPARLVPAYVRSKVASIPG